MRRTLAATLLTLAFMGSAALAQDGPIRRAGQAQDNAGKNIRYRVESEIARGQATVQERQLLARVTQRIESDKRFVGSALQFQVHPGGAVIVRGSVLNVAAKRSAVELVENTIGVTSVVDEVAVVKEFKVIKAKPSVEVIEMAPPVTSEMKVIVKP